MFFQDPGYNYLLPYVITIGSTIIPLCISSKNLTSRILSGNGQQFNYKEILKKIKILAEVNHNFETDRYPISATHFYKF